MSAGYVSKFHELLCDMHLPAAPDGHNDRLDGYLRRQAKRVRDSAAARDEDLAHVGRTNLDTLIERRRANATRDVRMSYPRVARRDNA